MDKPPGCGDPRPLGHSPRDPAPDLLPRLSVPWLVEHRAKEQGDTEPRVLPVTVGVGSHGVRLCGEDRERQLAGGGSAIGRTA
jgi:hypothetical protein